MQEWRGNSATLTTGDYIMAQRIKTADLIKSDVEAFGYYDAAMIAKKKRKLTFEQCYMMLFGKYPTR